MGYFSRFKLSSQGIFDFSIVALALGCGGVGYYRNLNEDEQAKKARLARDKMRRQRLRDREIRRQYVESLERLKNLSKLHEEKVKFLQQKRKEMLNLRDDMQTLSQRLQERHKQIEVEIEELRKLVKVKEELQARSQALGDTISKEDDSTQG